MPKQVERRSEERGEDVEIWDEKERAAIVKLGSLFDKWGARKGKSKEPKREKSFLEEIGIKL